MSKNNNPDDLPIVVAMTGASGAAYGKRLIEVLLHAGKEVHFAFSPAAGEVVEHELGISLSEIDFQPEMFLDAPTERFRHWQHRNLMAGIASGSFRTAGMVIVPCSMGTLAALATGNGTNLIHRAGEVHLKERRKLILVPRETPLSLIALENMASITRAGAMILPAMPGFYHRPHNIDDIVDFIVARICDQLGFDSELIKRWGDN